MTTKDWMHHQHSSTCTVILAADGFSGSLLIEATELSSSRSTQRARCPRHSSQGLNKTELLKFVLLDARRAVYSRYFVIGRGANPRRNLAPSLLVAIEYVYWRIPLEQGTAKRMMKKISWFPLPSTSKWSYLPFANRLAISLYPFSTYAQHIGMRVFTQLEVGCYPKIRIELTWCPWSCSLALHCACSATTVRGDPYHHDNSID